jgi:hypothetical protein
MFATALGKNKVSGFTQRLPTTTEIAIAALDPPILTSD